MNHEETSRRARAVITPAGLARVIGRTGGGAASRQANRSAAARSGLD